MVLFVDYFLVRKFAFLLKGVKHRSSVGFLGFVTSELLNLQRGVSFVFWLILFYLFVAYRMARGHEEASTSQTGRKRGTPRETPTISSLVVVMSVEDLIPSDKFLSPSDWRCQTARLLRQWERQIMPFILPESSLLLDFASRSLLW